MELELSEINAERVSLCMEIGSRSRICEYEKDVLRDAFAARPQDEATKLYILLRICCTTYYI